MGFLLAGLHKDLFEILWEGWQAIGAVKPEGRVEIRTAAEVQRKLEKASTKRAAETSLQCPACRFNIKIDTSQIDNEWRVAERRVLKDDADPIFLENDQYSFLMKVINGLRPPQLRLMLFDELLGTMENVEKNWKGDEVELRSKYSSQTELA